MKLFLDTNVLIDFILEREPFYAPAASIISYASDGKAEIAVSSITIVNTCYICVERCKMPLPMFRMKVDFLRNLLQVVEVGGSEVYASYDSGWADFEDGVQYFCAIRGGTDAIVTRNAADFGKSGIPVLTPDEAVDAIESAK